jgi:ketosteroid isomerase-like protein
MSEAHKQTLESANAAIRKRDFEGFLKFCTEDTTWTFEGDRTLTGKDAVRQWMQTAYVEAPDFQLHRMIADGEFVAALGEIMVKDAPAATQTPPLMATPNSPTPATSR